MRFQKHNLDKIPGESGVYQMHGPDEILYVGKAKNLKKRVRQYFAPFQDKRAMIPFLISKVEWIEIIVTPNEKEALILENNLIKKHQPRYNALLKDDKTFVSIFMNTHHPYPKVQVVRIKGKPEQKGRYFGPYTSSYSARQTLELMRNLFPLRQCSDQELQRRKRPCILYGIKKCLAPCTKQCTDQEYQEVVQQARSFLEGKNQAVINTLYEEMNEASKNLEFEKANQILQGIRQIEEVTQKNSSLSQGARADCDVFGMYTSGNSYAVVKLLFREGRLIGADPFLFRDIAQEKNELWESFLLQHYQQEKPPKQILLPEKLHNEKILSEILGGKVSSPPMGKKRQLIQMAELNAKTHFQEEDQENVLHYLHDCLSLTKMPQTIDCFDVSNFAGKAPVASKVTFEHGHYQPKLNKLFHIKHAKGGDDYGCLREALTRHYSKAKEQDLLPDLCMIDGGKGHLSIAKEVFSELNIAVVDLISISKEESRHDKGLTQEIIHLAHRKQPAVLPVTSTQLQLLQKIRDEAHRVAIHFQRKTQKRSSIRSSLEEVPGIGKIKKQKLLSHFRSVARIKEASVDELKSVKGITEKDIANLKLYL